MNNKIKILKSYFFWFGTTKQFPKNSFYDKRFDTENQHWLAAADLEDKGVIFFSFTKKHKNFKKLKFKTALKKVIDDFDVDYISKIDLIELLNASYEDGPFAYSSKNGVISDDIDVDDKMSKHKNVVYCMYSPRYHDDDEIFYDVKKNKLTYGADELNLDDLHFGNVGRSHRDYEILGIYNLNNKS